MPARSPRCTPTTAADAVNLVHYLAFRHDDNRTVQRRLRQRGLSSLGSCEPHVLATVEKVRELTGGPARPVPPSLSFESGRSALDHNTDALFGPRPSGRVTRVMVTLPSEAASDEALVRRLVSSGMDIARINGAHDDASAWLAMARNVRTASADIHRPCLISVDLPGPKLRTGPLEPGPEVLRLRPERDLRGRAFAPASAVLVSEPSPHPATTEILVDSAWLGRRALGDHIALTDARGSKRRLVLTGVGEGNCPFEVWDTTYLESGCPLDCHGDVTGVGPLHLFRSSMFCGRATSSSLTRTLEPSEPWHHGNRAWPGSAAPSQRHSHSATPGQTSFSTTARSPVPSSVWRTTPSRARHEGIARGTRLRAEKGINLPETELPIDAVTDADSPSCTSPPPTRDMVAVSFVRGERDVAMARSYLQGVGAGELGLILKIETPSAFSHLPDILLQGMQSRLIGIMIARGDLAVEAG